MKIFFINQNYFVTVPQKCSVKYISFFWGSRLLNLVHFLSNSNAVNVTSRRKPVKCVCIVYIYNLYHFTISLAFTKLFCLSNLLKRKCVNKLKIIILEVNNVCK